MKGQFGPTGALYDAWETRRHNPTFDWVIIRLGADSHLAYVDIDTSHFKGNECPQSQVFGLHGDTTDLKPTDKRWEELLPVVTLGPDSRHIFELSQAAKEGVWSALMVRMIPDGGMARLRAYGRPVPPTLLQTLPPRSVEPIDLLSPRNGGRIVSCSDANFSPASNLLLRGRGVDMSDGWETRRSQVGRGAYAPGGSREGQERKEWVVARLGVTGCIQYVEIDTAFHPGNYPVAASLEGILSDDEEPTGTWTAVVHKTKLGSHRQHWLASESGAVFSHVRLSIYPDGGLKRLRVHGHPLAPTASTLVPRPQLTALPLTPEAFAPYGDVIQAWELPSSAPRGTRVSKANQGTADKFHNLAKVEHTYAPEQLKRGGVALACMRAGPQFDVRNGADIPVLKLERHAATTQAFIPMGRTEHKAGGTFVVVVALNGPDDKPDLSTLRAFIPTSAQGVSYQQGIWHHPMLTVNEFVDYACLDAQTGDEGLKIDCETLFEHWADIHVPPYDPVQAPQAPTPVQPAPTTEVDVIQPEPITHQAFAKFGELVRAYPNPSEAPEGILHGGNPALQVTKLSWLSNLADSYKPEDNAKTSVGVYRAKPYTQSSVFDIHLMERHEFTSQAFIPMGKDAWEGKGESPLPAGGKMIVIVAEGGNKPDPTTLKAFIMEPSCALNYKPGVWHHPVIVTAEMDLACIETQVGDERDCEVIEFEKPFARVAIV